MKITGSEAVMKVLLEQGVDTVFGYPGGCALNLYDELYKYRDKIKHVLTADEQGAAHAADGYARATAKTGVAIATSGPGATNLVTGIATAYMDSIPTVFIVANVGKKFIGGDAFQEVYITGVTLPITKHNYFVNEKEDLVDALRNAFRIANSGRKGPVLVDITKDVTAALVDYEPMVPLPTTKVYKDESDAEKLDIFADYINNAHRPVILAGGGIVAAKAEKRVIELASKADIPVAFTLMGLGILPEESRQNIGMLGMHGSFAVNKCVCEADVILAIGCRFSDRVALKPEKFTKNAKILQIDIDPSEINKNVKVDVGIVGNCKPVLENLLPKIVKKEHNNWWGKIEEWKREHPLKVFEDHGMLNPQQVLEYVSDHSDKETIYVTDVGQHQMWAAQYLKQTRSRNFITSGGLGTMGYGYGAAIGAQMGCPEKRVIHITGDGSFHMNLNEACTAVSNNMPIITIILNNTVLGMVYQWQTEFYDHRYSNTAPERRTDFAKLAEGFGAQGFRADTMEEFEAAFEKALTYEGPTWIDCRISPEDKVLPMIPSTKGLEDMLFE